MQRIIKVYNSLIGSTYIQELPFNGKITLGNLELHGLICRNCKKSADMLK